MANEIGDFQRIRDAIGDRLPGEINSGIELVPGVNCEDGPRGGIRWLTNLDGIEYAIAVVPVAEVPGSETAFDFMVYEVDQKEGP